MEIDGSKVTQLLAQTLSEVISKALHQGERQGKLLPDR